MNYRALISKMTLPEKVSLCSGLDYWHTKPIPRLRVPSIVLSDGPHGLRRLSMKGKQHGLGASIPSTCFPTAAALANTWDEALLTRVGEALGAEAAALGVSVLLGPGCNIKRNPLCGRNFEYFSEDPFLSGKAASAMIRGIQSKGVSACVKHFAANSQELHRLVNNSVVDERTLRELYLPAFEMAVKEGGVRCLMASYNRINGTYATEHPHLLQDILYRDWGYRGVVVSDWGANNDRVAALNAGCHLEMPGCSGQTDLELAAAVQNGSLSEAVLDERLETLLKLIYDTKPSKNPKGYDKQAHHMLAAEAAEKAAVLLKNENNLLPLKPDSKVAVIGCFAKAPRYQGDGSSKVNPTKLDNALDALFAEGVNIVGYAPGFRTDGRQDKTLVKKACVLAQKADTVLLFLGLTEHDEAEGKDRRHMRLASNQLSLLSALQAVHTPIAVVLSCGSAVEMDWDSEAVLLMGLSGQAGGTATARLLTGKAVPCGKLSETVPLRYADVPSAAYYPGCEATSEYRESVYVGYRYYQSAGIPVKYPFGYGLSYTSFAYSDLQLDGDCVHFTVRNTGAVSGTEIAQLYIAPNTAGIFRPQSELKGFACVQLAAGEAKTVTLPLTERSFAVWSTVENGWVTEPGDYTLRIGASCTDIRLTETVTKEGKPVENPYADKVFAPYYRAAVRQVPDESFAALLADDIPQSSWDTAQAHGMNHMIVHSATGKGFGKLLYRTTQAAHWSLTKLGRHSLARRIDEIRTLPYRSFYRMSDLLTQQQVEALLKAVNREKGGGRAFAAALLHRKKKR